MYASFGRRASYLAPLFGFVLLLGRGPSAHAQPAPDAAAPDVADEPPAGPFRLHEALRAPNWLLLEASHRLRYSALQHQFRPGLDAADQALQMRTLLGLGASHAGFTVFGELQDSRAYLTDQNSAVSTIVVNSMELLQAYAAVRVEGALQKDAVLDLRLGRQTLDLGSRRLVARNRYRNTIQNYTGLTARWDDGHGAELWLMWLLPVRVRPDNSDKPALLDNRIQFDEEDLDLRLWGAFFTYARLPLALKLEAYFFGLNEDDDAERQTANRQLYTPGARLSRAQASGEWDVDLETVVQFGTRHLTSDPLDREALRVRAHFHHVGFGYTLDAVMQPRLAFELDYASGDSQGTQGRYERFDSLYGPRRAEFGPTGIYGPMGRENLISTGLRLNVKPMDRLEGFVSWRANFLDEPADVFARTGVVDRSGASGRFAGNQLELRARLWLLPENLRWEVGGAAFFEGHFLHHAPNATGYGNPLFVYTDLEVLL